MVFASYKGLIRDIIRDGNRARRGGWAERSADPNSTPGHTPDSTCGAKSGPALSSNFIQLLCVSLCPRRPPLPWLHYACTATLYQRRKRLREGRATGVRRGVEGRGLGRAASRRDLATGESRERTGGDCGEGDRRVGDSGVA